MDTIEHNSRIEQRMVRLKVCRFGRDYPGGAINPRKTDRGASAALIASVREDGIIQPMLAKERDGYFYMAAGDRRLDALFRIHAPHINDSGYPVPWDALNGIDVPIILHHGGNALELGLQENLNRNDLHPVDRMEAFAELLRGRPGIVEGEAEAAPLTVEEIAARFALRPAQVRQSLKLGVLAPAIRERWRNGTLDAPTAEAFTLCRDEKQQVKILGKLERKVGPGGRITPHHVRQALKAQPGEVKRLLTFVTRAVYEAAGHSVDETLFSLMALTEDGKDVLGEPSVSDVVALKEMAEAKLADHCGVLTKLPKSEGGPWNWAKPAGAMPPGWQSWPRMELGRKLSINDRESVGCVVSIDAEGRLQVEEGIYWKEEPSFAKASEGGAPSESRQAPSVTLAKSEGDQPPSQPSPILGEGEVSAISGARIGDTLLSKIPDVEIGAELSPRLQQQLAEQLQAGLRAALEKRNDLALPLLLAGIASRGDIIGICPNNIIPIDATAWPFDEALDRYAAMDLGAQLRALAGVVAQAVTLRIESGETPPAFMAGPQALMRATAKAIGARKLKGHLAAAFDVEGYVKAAPKGALLDAIGQACGVQQREKLERAGRRAVQEFARVNLAEKGWIPAELGADVLNLAALASRVGGKNPPARKASAGRGKGRR